MSPSLSSISTRSLLRFRASPVWFNNGRDSLMKKCSLCSAKVSSITVMATSFSVSVGENRRTALTGSKSIPLVAVLPSVVKATVSGSEDDPTFTTLTVTALPLPSCTVSLLCGNPMVTAVEGLEHVILMSPVCTWMHIAVLPGLVNTAIWLIRTPWNGNGTEIRTPHSIPALQVSRSGSPVVYQAACNSYTSDVHFMYVMTHYHHQWYRYRWL